MHRRLFLCLSLALAGSALAQSTSRGEPKVLTDLPYKEGAISEYEKERCKLDLYLPPDAKAFATLVWFHGGGLKNGDKDGRQLKSDSVKTAKIARSLAGAGVAVVAPNYRLSPKVTFPAYVEDAAAAVAWTRQNVAAHGGDPARIYVGGHSAGGYLALMLGLDPQYLGAVGSKFLDIAGFVPVSGQTLTHYTIREERGLPKFPAVADLAAPLHLVRAETSPFLVLYADRDMPTRAEENALFVALMKEAGNKAITGRMISDRTHGSIASEIENDGDPARTAILDFIAQSAGSR